LKSLNNSTTTIEKIYRDKNSEFIASHPAPRILIVAGPGSERASYFSNAFNVGFSWTAKRTIYVSSFVRKLVKDLQGDVTQKLDEADAKRVYVRLFTDWREASSSGVTVHPNIVEDFIPISFQKSG